MIISIRIGFKLKICKDFKIHSVPGHVIKVPIIQFLENTVKPVFSGHSKEGKK